MNRYQLLAAEIFGYSYDNYEDHLGINIRYDKLMPKDVKVVERAVNEGWPLERIARQLKRDPDEAAAISEAFRAAREVVDAPTPAESFRRAVRQISREPSPRD